MSTNRILAIVVVLLVVAGGVYWWGLSHTPPASNTTDGTATTTGGGPDQGILPYNSGIEGTILKSPTCPVERPGESCPPAPFQTLVAIYRASDTTHAIVLTKSDAQGKFKASLPPGDYVVGAGESNLPRCTPVNVTVGAEGYAATIISCDTGIR